MRPPAVLEVAAITHPGRTREVNEDSVVVGSWLAHSIVEVPETFLLDLESPNCLLICDGMGGQVGGQKASASTAAYLRDHICKSGMDAESIRAHLQDANRLLYDAMSLRPELAGMGTTIVGIVTDARRGLLFNVGDSRGYVARDGCLARMTTDDTRDGQTYGSDDRLGRTGLVTQSVGGRVIYEEIDPHVHAFVPRPGGVWLLCSDGLSDLLSVDEMEPLVDADLRSSCTALLGAALSAGGYDNISIVMARYGQ